MEHNEWNHQKGSIFYRNILQKGWKDKAEQERGKYMEAVRLYKTSKEKPASIPRPAQHPPELPKLLPALSHQREIESSDSDFGEGQQKLQDYMEQIGDGYELPGPELYDHPISDNREILQANKQRIPEDNMMRNMKVAGHEIPMAPKRGLPTLVNATSLGKK